MKRYEEELFEALDNLYSIYENFIWKHDNSNLEVLIQDRAISFYLYKDNDVIDEIIFSFSDKEKSMYTYMSVRVMLMMFGNVHIYNEENIIYNMVHKSYLKLIVNDENILDVIKMIIDMQDYINVNEKMDLVLEIHNTLPRRICPKNFIKCMNERIELSKKLLRRV